MKIRQFKTRNFTVIITAEPEYDPDFSFDESGETEHNVRNGIWECFCAKVAVTCNGHELATDYLGNCIYADPMEFMDHKGRGRGKNAKYGSYFSDMVSTAIADARKELAKLATITNRTSNARLQLALMGNPQD